MSGNISPIAYSQEGLLKVPRKTYNLNNNDYSVSGQLIRRVQNTAIVVDILTEILMKTEKII